MEKKLFLLAVVLLLTAVTGSTALAIAPLGPPTAGLEQGQKRVAFEYGYREADLEASGLKVSAWGTMSVSDVYTGSLTLPDVESNAFIANFGYGATTKFFDGSYGPYFGFGTKLTFRKEEQLSWGAMFQMDWTNSDDDDLFELNFLDDEDVEVEYYEIIVAVGPTYEMNEQLRIYGGPFFYMLDGEYDLEINRSFSDSGLKLSFDIEEESQFGGYVGAEVDVTEKAPLIVELQFTADSWGFGAGIGYKF
ncbi:MAG: hypothetical protein ACYSWP_25695 [Planctomycetota bacterium]|jgi:hypothetical protein